jgi:hypothetical protein
MGARPTPTIPKQVTSPDATPTFAIVEFPRSLNRAGNMGMIRKPKTIKPTLNKKAEGPIPSSLIA